MKLILQITAGVVIGGLILDGIKLIFTKTLIDTGIKQFKEQSRNYTPPTMPQFKTPPVPKFEPPRSLFTPPNRQTPRPRPTQPQTNSFNSNKWGKIITTTETCYYRLNSRDNQKHCTPNN